MSGIAIAAQDRQLEIFALFSEHRCLEGVGEFPPASMRNDLAQSSTDQLRCAEITRIEAAPVGVADEPGRVGNQDHALGVVEDLDIEVALALQLRLDRLLLRDVEYQPAVLHHFATRIPYRECVLECVHERAV